MRNKTESKEKYPNWLSYTYALVSRVILRTALAPLLSWKQTPLSNANGYSILVGVPRLLLDVLDVPISSLNQAQRDNCKEILLVIDARKADLASLHGQDFEDLICARYPDLPLTFYYYNGVQNFVARLIDWNWVDCWLTWAIGLKECRTRYALLHDFDAVVVQNDFLERQYAAIRQSRAMFLGIHADLRYQYRLTPVLATVELFLDRDRVTQNYSPIQLFNKVRLYQGERIECDILREIQLLEPEEERIYSELDFGQLIHPHQLVSQWCALIKSKSLYSPSGFSPLLLLPYFKYVAGNEEELNETIKQLQRRECFVYLTGHKMGLSKLDQAGCDWVIKQIEALDVFFNVEVGSKVKTYIDCIRKIPNMKHGLTHELV